MDVINNFKSLPPETRVWIYQSNRKFSDEETTAVKNQLADFAEGWVSHNQALRAHADVYHNQFVVLMVDESLSGASGCSIDSSVKFIRQLQQQLGVDFFDRMTFAWKEGEEVKTAHRTAFAELYKEGALHSNTLVFDNLVNTKKAFEEKWLLPLGESWHARMV